MAVDDATGRDQGHVDGGAHLLQEGEEVRRTHAPQPAALGALDDQPVDAGVDRTPGVVDAADLVEEQHAGVPCSGGDRGRVADARDEQPVRPSRIQSRTSSTRPWPLSIRKNICSPSGASVTARATSYWAAVSARPAELVSISPMPPAAETAPASWARAKYPTGALKIGYWHPCAHDPVALERWLHEPAMVGGDPAAAAVAGVSRCLRRSDAATELDVVTDAFVDGLQWAFRLDALLVLVGVGVTVRMARSQRQAVRAAAPADAGRAVLGDRA